MEPREKHRLVGIFMLLVGVLGLASAPFVKMVSAGAVAAPVQITGYDVDQTPRSGFGCWSHEYTGTITNTGRTISGSVNCSTDGNQIANYAGGGGTLNDNQISTSTSGTHLFFTRNADDGQPINPVITLYLGGTFVIEAIRLFGGDIQGNAIPGALTGATVEIGGTSIALATIPFGTPNAIGVPVNGLLDLRDTALAGISTNRIVLRNFTSAFFGQPFDQFSITEISVDGSPVGISVAIDIRPQNDQNLVEPGSNQLVPVAVLSDANFDASAVVDRHSLTFGRTGDETSLAFCQPVPQDVNRDGRADLVCLFHAERTGFRVGDTAGVLKGRTTSDVPFSGQDRVCIGICR
jgi:hypothetical protein